MEYSFGEFDNVSKEHGQGESKSGGWFRPEEGANEIRILSGYGVITRHFRGRGVKPAICIGKDKGCLYHTEDDKPNVKYLMWIIDRKDGEIKIGEFGYTIVKQIADFKNTRDYSYDKLPNYDITIQKTVKGDQPSDTKYTVIPARKDTDLTPEEEEAFKDKPAISSIIDKIKEKALAPEIAAEKPKAPREVDPNEINPDDIPF